ncbi:MAG TPA: response regulator [bacterium]|nr:response regulator [bacterium]
MGLVGSLEDLGLGDILQIVSLSRKSGVLNLGWGEVKGKIIFRDGQVVAAWSSANKQSLAPLLEGRGLIPESRREAMDREINALPDAAAVKDHLVKGLKIVEGEIDELIRERIEAVVFHFFTWPEGIFSFELQDIVPDLAALEPPDHSFVLEVGLSPQFLAMEGTRLQDEHKRAREEAPVGPPLKGAAARPSRAEAGASAPVPSAQAQAPAAKEDFGSVSDALAFYEGKKKAMGLDETGTAPTEARQEQPGAASRPAPRPEPAAAPGIAPPPGDAPHLVIVDDDKFMLESMVHHLAAKGYRTNTFEEIGPALTYIQGLVDMRVRPGAVLADLLMPNLTGDSTLGGLEFLKKVKALNPAISQYIMTDYENLPARQRAEELGARFFFMKPKSSQLDDDFSSPELINFVQILENALLSEPKPPAPEPEREDGSVNLGEELRREFGEDVVPMHPGVEYLTPSRGLHMLKAMISELNDPGSNGQITLLILRFASELMNRAVIFLVAKNQLAGLGQFGIQIDGTDPQRHVRQIRIPLNEPSIFREAIQKRLPLKKPLKDTKWNKYLVERLGGNMPREVFVAPIIAGGKIAAILYGDNAPEETEIGDTESLEIFLAQAGLAMEKALLERRLKEMGKLPESS